MFSLLRGSLLNTRKNYPTFYFVLLRLIKSRFMQIQLPAKMAAGRRENMRDRAIAWFVLFILIRHR